MLNFLKKLFTSAEKPNLKALIEEGAFLVDVRSPQEYAQSKVKGSVNIPLDSISQQIAKFKDKKHIIVFCRSGNRSSQAKAILQRNGFTNVVNGGTFGNVNQFVK
ncbi:rhodanese-like domain-containing protein [Daejeonella sp.]|jgi:rhodanese-related sulfurtransferase|uniref:rhodanese-like domain-containing protein n=1 Tax=Daejeonella sp. TaxID=2805397 RepID=UPI003784D9C1